MGNSKAKAVIAVLALVGIIALALIAYRALTNSSAAQTDGPSSRTPSSTQIDTSRTASKNESSTSPTAAILDPSSAYASLSSELVSFDGETVTWADLAEGKPVIVNFWATWCPYCVDEMDDYQKLYEEYGSDVVFVMIDVCDGRRETREKAEYYVREHGYTFPIYFDFTNSTVNEFGVSGYPTTVVFTAEGNVEYAAAGRINATNMKALLDYLL